MRIPKFKVGDKVKVIRASTDEENDLWWDSWISEMSNYIGNKYTILGRSTTGDEYGATYPKYCLNNGGPDTYNFPEFVLQDAIVGRQLMLFDIF